MVREGRELAISRGLKERGRDPISTPYEIGQGEKIKDRALGR